MESPIDALVLRVTDPVGPGAPPAALPGRLTAELSRALAHTPHGTLRVGDLTVHRDFVDVRDVARAVALALALPGRLPRLLNIGSGRAAPVRDLAQGLADAPGSPALWRRRPPRRAGRRRAWPVLDVTPRSGSWGWRPRFTLAGSRLAGALGRGRCPASVAR